VVLVELAAAALGARTPSARLWLIAATRAIQMLAVLTLAGFQAGGVNALGLGKKDMLAGLRKGLAWSAGFAAVAGLLFLVFFLSGRNPLPLIRTPLPEAIYHRALFFFVGGLLAPVAEELVFRGLIFGYLRRWGLPAAVLISTALFAAIHPGPAIPVTQIVGGIVFAVAYHTGKSLMTPIVVHTLGNLAIFTLSLPFFHG
jgi:membrane protease YdiL (CAAX protease family)